MLLTELAIKNGGAWFTKAKIRGSRQSNDHRGSRPSLHIPDQSTASWSHTATLNPIATPRIPYSTGPRTTIVRIRTQLTASGVNAANA